MNKEEFEQWKLKHPVGSQVRVTGKWKTDESSLFWDREGMDKSIGQTYTIKKYHPTDNFVYLSNTWYYLPEVLEAVKRTSLEPGEGVACPTKEMAELLIPIINGGKHWLDSSFIGYWDTYKERTMYANIGGRLLYGTMYSLSDKKIIPIEEFIDIPSKPLRTELKPGEVVHCPTRAEAERLLPIICKSKKRIGELLNMFSFYGAETCFNGAVDDIQYSRKAYYEASPKTYTFIPITEFLNTTEQTTMKTQTITRAALAEIYPAVCEGWQAKIREALSLKKNLFKNEIEVDQETINQAFEQANTSQTLLLTQYFKKEEVLRAHMLRTGQIMLLFSSI